MPKHPRTATGGLVVIVIFVFFFFWGNTVKELPTRNIVDWSAKVTGQGTTTIINFFDSHNEAMTNLQFIQMLRSTKSFRTLLSKTISALPYDAVFMEFKPISLHNLGATTELAILNSAAVASIKADHTTFSRQLANAAPNEVRAFSNLGGDATLVSPCLNENQDIETYAHLANFLRLAPPQQLENLWKTVGNELQKRLEKGKPVWLSTSGLGVYWLHIRICDSPKYYAHSSYKEFKED